ncbi:MAG: hypothetical protein GWN84_01200 [Gammaproteobacteria bacterium]|nr:hypothetical protein [Gammaproteobacteria bacterium]NIR85429.1 hypothetical protein [Gammaproteobacteria bacterium]
MTDVVVAFGQKSDSIAYGRGRTDGMEWAQAKASCQELDQLADLSRRIGHDWAAWVQEAGALALPMAIGTTPEGDTEAAKQFWLKVAEEDWDLLAEAQFLEGFVDGALEMYDEISVLLGHA